MTETAREMWDAEAPRFDDEPDHGLRDGRVRDAWLALLMTVLPSPPAKVLDVGCGTGSLSVLLAERGYLVSGIDISPRMIERANGKARRTGVSVGFVTANAADPQGVGSGFDVVLGRHITWALPQPSEALDRWLRLLAPDGRLVLIEGVWNGVGISAIRLQQMLAPHVHDLVVQTLDEPTLWGRTINDERYVLIAHR